MKGIPLYQILVASRGLEQRKAGLLFIWELPNQKIKCQEGLTFED